MTVVPELIPPRLLHVPVPPTGNVPVRAAVPPAQMVRSVPALLFVPAAGIGAITIWTVSAEVVVHPGPLRSHLRRRVPAAVRPVTVLVALAGVVMVAAGVVPTLDQVPV